MSQDSVLNLLKKNPSCYLSAREISNILKINIQSVQSALNKMLKFNEIYTKTLVSAGVVGGTKMYGYKDTSEEFEEVLHNYQLIKDQDKRMEFINPGTLSNLLIVAEIKKLKNKGDDKDDNKK